MVEQVQRATGPITAVNTMAMKHQVHQTGWRVADWSVSSLALITMQHEQWAWRYTWRFLLLLPSNWSPSFISGFSHFQVEVEYNLTEGHGPQYAMAPYTLSCRICSECSTSTMWTAHHKTKGCPFLMGLTRVMLVSHMKCRLIRKKSNRFPGRRFSLTCCNSTYPAGQV